MRECILAWFGELEFCSVVLFCFVIFYIIIIIAIFYFPFTFSYCNNKFRLPVS